MKHFMKVPAQRLATLFFINDDGGRNKTRLVTRPSSLMRGGDIWNLGATVGKISPR